MKYGNILFYGEGLHNKYFELRKLLGSLFQNIFFGMLACFIRFSIDWFRNIYYQERMKRQNISSELNMLRLQISPHFLMNTLNNIYSLVLKKSDDAPNALLKLSEIMRYMLYDANIEKMPLHKEITYIKNYIDIQQLRLRKEHFANLNINMPNNDLRIAPLLLIPFIENAFKHGDHEREKKLYFYRHISYRKYATF